MRWLLLLLLAAGPAFARDARVVDMRVLFDMQGAGLVVTEVIVVEPADGGETGELVLPLPEGARLLRNARLVGLTERAGAGGTVSELVAKSSSQRVTLEATYAMQSATGSFHWKRSLPLPIVRLLGVSQEGRFELKTGDGLRVSRNVTRHEGRALGGRWAMIDGADLGADHALVVDFTAAAAVNPVSTLYVAVVLLVLVGFGLLQLGLVISQRQQQRRRASTDAFLAQLLEQLAVAEEAGEAKGEYATRLRKQLEGLLEED